MNVLVLFGLAIGLSILAGKFYSNYLAGSLERLILIVLLQRSATTTAGITFLPSFTFCLPITSQLSPERVRLSARLWPSCTVLFPVGYGSYSAVFMILTTVASLLILLWNKYLPQKNYILIGMDVLLLVLVGGSDFPGSQNRASAYQSQSLSQSGHFLTCCPRFA